MSIATEVNPTQYYLVRLNDRGQFASAIEEACDEIEALPESLLSAEATLAAMLPAYPKASIEPCVIRPLVVEAPVATLANSITSAQYKTAVRLAAAHGHQWGAACTRRNFGGHDPDLLAAVRRTIASRIELGESICLHLIEVASAAEGYGPVGGIGAPSLGEMTESGPLAVHTTRSGRVSWSVRPDGSAWIEVLRPNPLTRLLVDSPEWTPGLVELLRPIAHMAAGLTSIDTIEEVDLDLTDEPGRHYWREKSRPLLKLAQPRRVLGAEVTPEGKIEFLSQRPEPMFAYETRHLQALETCLRPLVAREELEKLLRPLYEAAPDYLDRCQESLALHAIDEISFNRGYADQCWNWFAGPVPTEERSKCAFGYAYRALGATAWYVVYSATDPAARSTVGGPFPTLEEAHAHLTLSAVLAHAKQAAHRQARDAAKVSDAERLEREWPYCLERLTVSEADEIALKLRYGAHFTTELAIARAALEDERAEYDRVMGEVYGD